MGSIERSNNTMNPPLLFRNVFHEFLFLFSFCGAILNKINELYPNEDPNRPVLHSICFRSLELDLLNVKRMISTVEFVASD